MDQNNQPVGKCRTGIWRTGNWMTFAWSNISDATTVAEQCNGNACLNAKD